jgi:acetylcholinesterase
VGWRLLLAEELGPNPKMLQDVFYNPPEAQSEDCLTANVFAPSEPSKISRAVVIFIPGGGWQIESSRLELAAFPAYHDIIAVSINYRTNGGW